MVQKRETKKLKPKTKKVVVKTVSSVKKKSKVLSKKKPLAKKEIKPKKIAKTPTKSKKADSKEKKIGTVTHYFDKIKVVVLKLSSEIKVGDKIRIKGGKETDFNQKIVSMEIDGKKIKKAKKGQQIGLKVKEKVRVGYLAYLVK
jgi:hypothetical protein